jgi:hypothetical protein
MRQSLQRMIRKTFNPSHPFGNHNQKILLLRRDILRDFKEFGCRNVIPRFFSKTTLKTARRHAVAE